VKILGVNPGVTFHKPEGGFYLFARLCNQRGKNGRPLTDEDFVISLMEKTGIFAHPGYFYDYDKGVNVLISLLAPPKVLTQNLKKLSAVVGETPRG
jgi:aspartate/methionine/tyrosine aminotransferase